MKNTVKTLLSGLTTLAVTFSALSFTALATENKDTNDMTELIISSHEAYAGDIVTVTVDIKNNPGITAFGAVLNYDSELEFVEYEKQSLMSMVNAQTLDTNIAIGAASSSISTKDASVINLMFKVPEDAESDTVYYINWVKIQQLACNNKEIISTQTNGSITVIERKVQPQEIGNINSDNKIDATDATLILKHYTASMLNKKSELSEESLKAADINKDGIVNSTDAFLILKFYVNSLLNPNITLEEVLNR